MRTLAILRITECEEEKEAEEKEEEEKKEKERTRRTAWAERVRVSEDDKEQFCE